MAEATSTAARATECVAGPKASCRSASAASAGSAQRTAGRVEGRRAARARSSRYTATRAMTQSQAFVPVRQASSASRAALRRRPATAAAVAPIRSAVSSGSATVEVAVIQKIGLRAQSSTASRPARREGASAFTMASVARASSALAPLSTPSCQTPKSFRRPAASSW